MHITSNGTAPAGAERSRFACTVAFADVDAELGALIEKAVSAVAGGVPAPDAILGRYVGLAGLIRAVSFHEGRLLEEAIAVLARHNPDLVVLTQGLRLPVTPAALDAIANNVGRALRGLSFDADARTRASYTPDLVIVHRAAHRAYVLDIKRSILSYLDTHRLAELKTRMMAGALILPDWLYKEHKRLMVDEVGIAIVDGASGPSDHESGIWAMSEIDDLLEIDGAATAMDELRHRFAGRIQRLLDAETGKLVPDPARPPAAMSDWGAPPLCQTLASEDDARSIRIGFARMRLHA